MGAAKPSNSRADGFVRGEGCGMVLLKRLSDAQADGDPILAVIRGSAVNQDGHTNGLTAPNGLSQQAVIRQALENAGVKPEQLSYVETHGTGTSLGDPIEVEALGAVLGTPRPDGLPLILGSAKTNIGHLEGSAGVAGLIKAVLALQHRTIPSNLHFQQLNPHISLAGTRLEIAATERPWQIPAEPLLAGVSSFGWSGVNAHVILEEAPLLTTSTHPSEAAHYILPISARSRQALVSLAQAYARQINAENTPLSDLCRAALERRTHHGERLAAVGQNTAELLENLNAFTRGETRPGLTVNTCFAGRLPGIVFVFPGQGGQWVGMGRQLLAGELVFRQSIERCETAFRSYVSWSLREILSADENTSHLEEIDVIQPLLFAVQVALADLWRSWGVQPEAVVGHSMGEVAAAYVAGALSLEDAARVICTRSRLMKRLSGKGAMAVVGLTLDQAQQAILAYPDQLSVAVNNSPVSSVLSGDPDALQAVVAELQSQSIFCRSVKVDVAAHSPQMQSLVAELVDALQEIKPQATSIPLYSTVLGGQVSATSLDAAYWGRNLREVVRFSQATRHLLDDGYATFIEINPHPILLTAIEQTAQTSHADLQLALTPSLRRGEDEQLTMLTSLGSLFTVGYPPLWGPLLPPGDARTVKLPHYPWQREKFWLDAPLNRPMAASGAVQTLHEAHPLLNERVDLPNQAGLFWRIVLQRSKFPALFGHRLNGMAFLAGSTMVELALAAGERALSGQDWKLVDVSFLRALALPEDEKQPISLQATLADSGNGGFRFGLFHRLGDAWQQHVLARVQHNNQGQPNSVASVGEIRARMAVNLSGQEFYRILEKKNVQIEPSLQGIIQLWRGNGEILAQLAPAFEEHFTMEPRLLDAGFQLLGLITDGVTGDLCMPVEAEEIIRGDWTSQPAWVHASLRQPASPASLVTDLQWLNEKGDLVLKVVGLHLKPFEQAGQASDNPADWLFALRWEAVGENPPAEKLSLAGNWLILADQQGFGDALAARLEQQGAHCTLIQAGVTPASLDTHILQAGDWKGIINLWSLNIPQSADLSASGQQESQVLGCGSTLNVIHELMKGKAVHPPQVWLVTQGAQAVQPSDQVQSTQATLWGLGRVISQEAREFFGGLIDLPANAAAETAAETLLSAIAQPGDENQLAWRDELWYTPRLIQYEQAPPTITRPIFRSDAAYVITGGLGGIGLEIARWAIQKGARRLILMGRTPLPPRSTWREQHPPRIRQNIQAVSELEALGAGIYYAALDIADTDQLTTYLNTYRAEGWPAIGGVFHAAGVIDDKLLTQLDDASLWTVMRPKVVGGWALHQYFKDQPLDFFVLFSSLGALFGQPGQGNYAAANAFLDALAHERQAQGLPGLSINWGAWSGLGFAATSGGKRVLEKLQIQGLEALNAENGLKALELLMGQNLPQAAVAPINHTRFLTSGLTNERLWRRFLQEQQQTTPSQAGNASQTFPDQLRALPADQQRSTLMPYLQTTLAQVLRMAPERIEPHAPFGSLGLELLLAVEFRNRLEASLGLKLSVTIVWNYPTLSDLTSFLLEKLGGPVPAEKSAESDTAASKPPPARSSDVAQKVQAMSDQDALRALKRRKGK